MTIEVESVGCADLLSLDAKKLSAEINLFETTAEIKTQIKGMAMERWRLKRGDKDTIGNPPAKH